MGLLGIIAARNSPDNSSAGSSGIQAAINGFHRENPLFHCVVMHLGTDDEQCISDIALMTAFHGAVCLSLTGGNGLLLLPGGLDRELFSHQISRSTGSTVLFQFSANASSLAFETLSPYLR